MADYSQYVLEQFKGMVFQKIKEREKEGIVFPEIIKIAHNATTGEYFCNIEGKAKEDFDNAYILMAKGFGKILSYVFTISKTTMYFAVKFEKDGKINSTEINF